MALKPGEVSIKPWANHKFYRYRVNYHAAGKLQRKGFAKKKDAEEWAAEWRQRVEEGGNRSQIADAERHAVLDHRADLQESGIDLREAIRIALDYQARIRASISVSELIQRHIRTKQAEKVSTAHIRSLQCHLSKFENSFADRTVATVTTEEISEWLLELDTDSTTTVSNYRTSLYAIFERARKSGWCQTNPVEGAFNPKRDRPDIGHLSVKEAEILLLSACNLIRPVVAIGLFAGLRRSEIESLAWEDVKLRDGTEGDYGSIRIRKGKTGGRVIEIQPVLAAWLRDYAGSTGPVWPVNGRKLFEAARLRAGFGSRGEVESAREEGRELKPWPDNAMRHSFGTFHHAAFQNLASTAKQMGNSPAIIAKHYDAVAERREGSAFFDLFPQAPIR